MTHNHYPTDPAHTFLSAKEVIARYGWGRTKGYEVLAQPTFPRAIAGRYRLDTPDRLGGRAAGRRGRRGGRGHHRRGARAGAGVR
jgi:hypothetical protein